jgi:probable selenium-dependent hydroxylase accessory protein YqeC
VDYVVVEADGARGLPAKAPGRHEPALPDGPTDVLAVIGADALNRVIADQCHRPLRVAAVIGCSPYERLDPVRAAILLSHPDGARRGVDNGFGIVVTKVSPINRPLVDRLVAAMAEQLPGVPMHLIADQHAG